MNIKIRHITEKDYYLLPDLLYEAIFIAEGIERPDKNIINRPELACYYQGFGRTGDYGLVAEIDNNIIGACWVRLFRETQKGYGYIADDIPEICMAVFPEYRKRGIGTKLFTQMLTDLKNLGYPSVSLSVDLINYAYNMYKKFGFITQQEDSESATMLKTLT